MSKLLIFLICALNLSSAFSMDCNEKKLEVIINSFVTKIEAGIPITQQHILQALQHCGNFSLQDLSLHNQENVSHNILIFDKSEQLSNLNNPLAIFNKIQTPHPIANEILEKISESVSQKIKENDQKQKELMEWKNNNPLRPPLSSPKEGEISVYSKDKDILDYFANADSYLRKK